MEEQSDLKVWEAVHIEIHVGDRIYRFQCRLWVRRGYHDCPMLKQCDNDLSRENIMKQAANLKDFRAPLLYPGITINTSPTNYSPIRQLQLQTFNGEGWEPIGDVMSD